MATTTGIAHSKENKLVTLKGRALRNGNPQIFLMGLIEMEKVKERTVGWILLISGNPLIPHGIGKNFSNKVRINSLPISEPQKRAILQVSLVPNGDAYLYAGKFTTKKCPKSVQFERNDLNIFLPLCDKLNQYAVEVDTIRVVHFSKRLVSRVILLQTINAADSKTMARALSLEMAEKVSQIKFLWRISGDKVFVEMESPRFHDKYNVLILLLQTYMCKSKGKSCDRLQRVTKVVDKVEKYIPPNGNTDPDVFPKVKIPLPMLKLPVRKRLSKECEEDVQVQYWGDFKIFQGQEWKTIVRTKLMETGERAPRGNVKGEPITTFRLPAPEILESRAISTCPNCFKLTNIVIYEMKLLP